MASPERIADLERDRNFWDHLQAETQERFGDLISLQGKGVTWPNQSGGDDLADAINELDEANREIARHRTAAQARLDRARSGEDI